MEVEDTKNPDYQDTARFTTLQKNANTIIEEWPISFWLEFLSEFCFSYKHDYVKTKNKKKENQQFHTRGPNEEYMLSVNLNGREKKTSVKHQIAKTIPMLKNAQITTVKPQFWTLPITKKTDVSKNLDPLACIYLYIYIHITNLNSHRVSTTLPKITPPRSSTNPSKWLCEVGQRLQPGCV